MLSRAVLMAAAGVLALACGCGTPGAPQPPSLHLPRPVHDLSATRKGSQVALSWTMPTKTTDRETIRRYGKVRICRSLNQFPVVQCIPAGELDVSAFPPPRQGASPASYTDALPPQLASGVASDFATYAVEVENPEGRSAGLSNQLQVPLAPVPQPPTHLAAQVMSQGIELGWTPAPPPPAQPELVYVYRIRRALAGKPLAPIFEVSPATAGAYLDRSFEWQQEYVYSITPVTRILAPGGATKQEIEGNDTPEIKVFARDVFPPAQPGGVQAVFSGNLAQPFIDLTWRPNTESDLAGYNLYRRTQSTPPVQINSALVKAPAFRDSAVTPGVQYFYSVNAVDLRGNQSPRSQEASETVPAK